jgi:peptidyl-prolyl cis-trans isomerase C
MPVTINEREISDEMIAHEATHHEGAQAPLAAAACALAVRALLLERARELDLIAAGEEAQDDVCDAAIERLLEREAPVPEPSEDECRRYYARHRSEFPGAELAEAAHILFAVTPNAPVDAIRRQAESVLKQAIAEPSRFGALAREFSNCPSSAQDGVLGQLSCGDTVPEFDQALFESEKTGVLPRLVRTRYGFHIVAVAHRVPARDADFELLRPRIAARLRARTQRKAAEQYVRLLASRARIAGVDLGASGSPLVQ